MKVRFVVPLLAVLFAASASVTVSQSAPSPSPSPVPTSGIPGVNIPGLPSTGQVINDVVQDVLGRTTGAFGYNPNRADGTVTYFRRFNMQVQMQLNKYREIHLHQGTVINPRGWTIQAGQNVDVVGRPNADGSLEADVITVHQ